MESLDIPDAPSSPAWTELSKLMDRRAALAARIDDLDAVQREANDQAARAAAAVSEAERAGEPDTKRLDSALSKARARANEPWAERRAGARQALADHDNAIIGVFVRERFDDLHAGLAEQGEAAAPAVNAAAGELVSAHARWQEISSRMVSLSSALGPMRPGDYSRSLSERAAGEAGRLLDEGGEEAPTCRDPRAPRHGQPVAAAFGQDPWSS